MSARQAGKAKKPPNRRRASAPCPQAAESLKKAARQYLGVVLEHAEWIGRELALCQSRTYHPNAVLADGYCKTLRWRLAPAAAAGGVEIDMNPLAGYGVESISLMSVLSRGVLGEDFPRATDWLWRLLDELPADVWTSGKPPAARIVRDWRQAVRMLRGCLVSPIIADGDGGADLEGLPVDIAARLQRGDFLARSDEEDAKLDAWVERVNADRAKLITSAVAAKRFHCSQPTLRRLVKEGELTDHRPPGHAKNAPLILDEAEIARRFQVRE